MTATVANKAILSLKIISWAKQSSYVLKLTFLFQDILTEQKSTASSYW